MVVYNLYSGKNTRSVHVSRFIGLDSQFYFTHLGHYRLARPPFFFPPSVEHSASFHAMSDGTLIQAGSGRRHAYRPLPPPNEACG